MPRKRTYRKDKGEKGKKGLGLFVFVLILLATLAILSITVFFPIRTIEVTGLERWYYGREQEIIAASGVEVGDNLILANGNRIGARLGRYMPYVESVRLVRNFPFGLTIEVTEAQVFAQILMEEDEFLRINRSGKVLETAEFLPGTPVVKGFEADDIEEEQLNSQRYNELVKVIDAFNEQEIYNITVVNLENKQDIRVTYNDRIVLILGSSANLEQKLIHAVRTEKLLPASAETGTLNLSRIPGRRNEASFIPKALEENEVSPAFSQE